MYLTIKINVPKIKTTKEGQDWCCALSDHILDTFNDDVSIESISYAVPKDRQETKS